MISELSEDCTSASNGVENSLLFKSVWDNHANVEDFLHSHDYITVRASKVSVKEFEEGFISTADVDGVTIEWNDLSGTSHEFHHLFLVPKGILSLSPVYKWLKKHENLGNYTTEARQELRRSQGTSILCDNGWNYILALLPEYGNTVIREKTVILQATLNWISEVKTELSNRFKAEIKNLSIRHTLDKNNIHDLSQIFILPCDFRAILKLFNECLQFTPTPQGYRKILFSFRFGEKNTNGVHLPIRDLTCVSKVCIHAGLSIESASSEESLFWSRVGLQQLVGNRGCLTTTCGLRECANYQSNLDGLAMIVQNDVKRICKYPENIRFLQMYTDISHCYPNCRIHPISGAIMICSGLKAHSQALVRDAYTYLSEVNSNFTKFVNSQCRLEFVVDMPTLTTYMTGAELISVERVCELLSKYPLIVNFADEHFLMCLKTVGLHLCDTLKNLLEKDVGTGNSGSVWKAYQYELAIEKLLWGHPLSFISNQYSVNLGPGLGYPSRSSSDAFGFLKLEHEYSCCVDEYTAPPLEIYSRNVTVQGQLQRLFGFSDSICASDAVVGRKLMELLITDLHGIGSVYMLSGEFLDNLKTGNHTMRVVGVMSKVQLAEKLHEIQKCKFPMIFTFLLQMLRRAQKDIKTILSLGIEELGLSHFPAYRQYDESRNICMYWRYSYGVWALQDLDTEKASLETQANLLSALVLQELESKRLCFTKSLTGTSFSFPWILPCLRKLTQLNLRERDLVHILTMATCLALKENGLFIDFIKLAHLVEQLPLPQYRLRQLEIQGKFLLPNMNIIKVWRLHPSIPRKIPKSVEDTVQKPFVKPKSVLVSYSLDDDVTKIDSNEIQESFEGGRIKKSVDFHLDSNIRRRWSPKELSILEQTLAQFEVGTVNAYKHYQSLCRVDGIPDHSFHSFRRQFKRRKP